MNPERIVLVYNADNGLFNALVDWSHKFFSPETYQCTLCRYTFGVFGMLVPWKNLLQSLPFPSRFLYRDEFRNDYPDFAAIPLPVVLVEKDGVTEILIHAGEIKGTGGVAALMGLLTTRLEQWASRRSTYEGEISAKDL